jgi:mannose-6-phosphate isomerase-like protein (cupin superfamily)
LRTTRSGGVGASHLRVGPSEGRFADDSPHLFKATSFDTGGRFDFFVALLSPMTGPPLHLHREQHDTLYVLEGVLTVQVGEETFDIGPGDFLAIPPEVPHTFENLQPEGRLVRAINLVTPGGHFDMFNEMSGALDEETAKAIATRFGTEILGPPLRVSLGLR